MPGGRPVARSRPVDEIARVSESPPPHDASSAAKKTANARRCFGADPCMKLPFKSTGQGLGADSETIRPSVAGLKPGRPLAHGGSETRTPEGSLTRGRGENPKLPIRSCEPDLSRNAQIRDFVHVRHGERRQTIAFGWIRCVRRRGGGSRPNTLVCEHSCSARVDFGSRRHRRRQAIVLTIPAAGMTVPASSSRAKPAPSIRGSWRDPDPLEGGLACAWDCTRIRQRLRS